MPFYYLSPEAKNDFLKVYVYTKEKCGVQQAHKYLEILENSCKEITQKPNMGRDRSEIKPGFKSITGGRHIIFYRVSDTKIEILRVLNERMDIDASYANEINFDYSGL